jgi:hypothetical protein
MLLSQQKCSILLEEKPSPSLVFIKNKRIKTSVFSRPHTAQHALSMCLDPTHRLIPAKPPPPVH